MDCHKEPNTLLVLDNFYRLLKLPRSQKIELDLGCGNGRFSQEAAIRFPDRIFLAADIMMGRIRRCDNRARQSHLKNMYTIRAEARLLVGALLPFNSLDRIHVLCPDPWPKERHRHHRLISSEFTGQLHQVLKDNGEFHFSSDDQPYVEIVTRLLDNSGIFKRDDSRLAELEGIKTDFEQRWLAKGKTVTHRLWVKQPYQFQGKGH